MHSDQNMSEVVVNGASGCKMWFATPAFTCSDLLLRPKYSTDRADQRVGVGGVRGKGEIETGESRNGLYIVLMNVPYSLLYTI